MRRWRYNGWFRFPLFGPPVNPHLDKLQPYPFEKLRQLFAKVTPNAAWMNSFHAVSKYVA